MRSHVFARLSGHARRIHTAAVVVVVALFLTPGAALASKKGGTSFHPTIDIPQLLGIVLFIVGVVALGVLVRYAHKADAMNNGMFFGIVVLIGLIIGLVLMHSFGLPSFTLRKP